MRLILALPLLALLVVFALSNSQPARLGLWPFDWAVEAPLSLLMLAAMGFAFLAGGIVVWASDLAGRRREREARHTVRLLEAQIAELRAGQVRDRPSDPP